MSSSIQRLTDLRRLDSRVVTIASARNHLAVADLVDESIGGLVLTGQGSAEAIHRLRLAGSRFPALVEPENTKSATASADNPFGCVVEGGLFQRTLAELLADQRLTGASAVMTPTGQIRAQDSKTLKAVITAANAIEDDDVVVMAPLAPQWLGDTHLQQLVAVLGTSVHPVAVCMCASDKNPLEATKATIDGYKRLFRDVPNLIAYRTDLSGLGAIACGATSAVIGLIPSHRRLAVVGQASRASNPAVPTPHILIPELLRFTRVREMQTRWFVSTDPLTCDRPCCNGAGIDRFDNSREDAVAALRHNQTALSELASELLSLPLGQRLSWWAARLRAAQAAHFELSQRIKQEVSPPADLRAWLRTL